MQIYNFDHKYAHNVKANHSFLSRAIIQTLRVAVCKDRHRKARPPEIPSQTYQTTIETDPQQCWKKKVLLSTNPWSGFGVPKGNAVNQYIAGPCAGHALDKTKFGRFRINKRQYI
jgi:hypothetical protein